MTEQRQHNNELIRQAKAASIFDVISARMDLKPDGKEYKGLCPFHAERSPSFTVVPARGFFHCFGCGAHGDAINFIERFDSVDFLRACKRIVCAAASRRTPVCA